MRGDNPYGYEPSEFQAAIDSAVFEGRARRAAKRILQDEENPSQEMPEIIDLDTLLAMPEEDVTFRVEGWQPAGGRALLAAQYKAGKAVAVDEPILTQRGWVKMGEVREGDYVHAPDGTQVRVLGVSQVYEGRECYRVVLADGRSVVVDGEHLWTVYDLGRSRELTVTTAEMAPQVVQWTNGSNVHYRYRLSIAAPLQRTHHTLPIDPYVFGVWLGDGTSATGEITTVDVDVVDELERRGYKATGAKGGDSAGRAVSFRFARLHRELRVCGYLGRKGVKYVPAIYLEASEDQRLALLQGLLDTDGYCGKPRAGGTARIEFCNTNKKLARAVLFLARSLGWKATLRTGRASLYGKDCGPKYRVCFSAHRGQQPFKLERKLARLPERPHRAPRSQSVKIVAIDRVPPVPVRCIYVDHPSHLYLVGRGLIPTHNTTFTGNLTRSLVDGTPFLSGWKVHPVGRVCILDFEMSPSTARRWLGKQGIRNRKSVYLVSLRGKASTFNILDPVVRRAWEKRLAARDIDYLILDCLRPALDALGLDEHRDAGKFLGPLDALLNEAGIGEACVVHHMGHGGERSRGDSRLRDWPDVEWRLMREDDRPNSPRYVTAFGRDVDIPEHKLQYDDESKHLTAVTGSRLDLEADAALVAVLGILEHQGEAVSGRVIESALKGSDHSRSSIRAAVKLGVRRGLIDTRLGTHNAALFELPGSGWVRSRFGGAEG